MPAPYEYDYDKPLDLPESRTDLEFIASVAKDVLGEGVDPNTPAVESLGDGHIKFIPSGDGGYCVVVGPPLSEASPELTEGDSDTSSRTLVFDGFMRIKRAVVGVNTDMGPDGMGGKLYTKRIPKSAAGAFVTSIATSIRDEL